MSPAFLVKGFIIGFSVAAPIGPIGVLCIKRTLTQGRLAGFVSGLGAATADGLYSIIAAFGLTFISSAMVDHQLPLRIIGGTFLTYLGIKTFSSKPAHVAAAETHRNLLGNYLSTLFLTITNPMTIIAYGAIFAGVGLVEAHATHGEAALLVLGVLGGSVVWSMILSSGVHFMKSNILKHPLRIINKLSGVVILFFAAVVWISVFRELQK